MKLTKTVVEQLSVADRDQFVWDDRLPGFGVKVTPRGGRIYVFQYRPKHVRRTRRYTIGGHGAPWTTEKAREAAENLAARVKLGEDPFAAGKAVVAAAEAKLVTAKAAKERRAKNRIELVTANFVERYAKPKNRNWAETQRIFDREILPHWSGRSITSVKRRDVIELIDGIQDRAPAMARNVFAQLRKFFNWCVERDLIEASPSTGLRAPPIQAARDRWLSDTEITLFWKGCEALGRPFGPLFQLLLLTAQRRDEVTGLRWTELDLEKGEWIIPAARAKNGKAHAVDLSPEAIAILERQPRTSELVFSVTGETPVSGHGHAKAMLDLRIEAARLQKNAKARSGEAVPPMAPWRAHDLRRTAATGMAALGHGPHVIEAVLNHISGVRSGLVGVYQHYQYRAERKAALLGWGRHVAQLIGAR